MGASQCSGIPVIFKWDVCLNLKQFPYLNLFQSHIAVSSLTTLLFLSFRSPILLCLCLNITLFNCMRVPNFLKKQWIIVRYFALAHVCISFVKELLNKKGFFWPFGSKKGAKKGGKRGGKKKKGKKKKWKQSQWWKICHYASQRCPRVLRSY